MEESYSYASLMKGLELAMQGFKRGFQSLSKRTAEWYFLDAFDKKFAHENDSTQKPEKVFKSIRKSISDEQLSKKSCKLASKIVDEVEKIAKSSKDIDAFKRDFFGFYVCYREVALNHFKNSCATLKTLQSVLGYIEERLDMGKKLEEVSGLESQEVESICNNLSEYLDDAMYVTEENINSINQEIEEERD